jgi:hypothetical protein
MRQTSGLGRSVNLHETAFEVPIDSYRHNTALLCASSQGRRRRLPIDLSTAEQRLVEVDARDERSAARHVLTGGVTRAWP